MSLTMNQTEDEVLKEFRDKIANVFVLDNKFWNALEEFKVFPPDYIRHQQEQDISDCDKKANIVLDIRKQAPHTFKQFDLLLAKYYNRSILSDIYKPLSRQVYPILSPQPGYCVIVNNFSFTQSTKWQDREGSWEDLNIFEEIFKKLNYKVKTLCNRSREQTLKEYKQISRARDLVNHDAFVSIIMSHGVSDHFISEDSQNVAYSEIYDFFSKDKCTALNGKPKVFIFNCCRNQDDNGNNQVHSANSDGTEACIYEDFWIVFSTLNKSYSNRHTLKGTFFANAIKDSMLKDGKIIQTDLDKIVTQANVLYKDRTFLQRYVGENSSDEPFQAIELRTFGKTRPAFEFNYLNKLH